MVPQVVVRRCGVSILLLILTRGTTTSSPEIRVLMRPTEDPDQGSNFRTVSSGDSSYITATPGGSFTPAMRAQSGWNWIVSYLLREEAKSCSTSRVTLETVPPEPQTERKQLQVLLVLFSSSNPVVEVLTQPKRNQSTLSFRVNSWFFSPGRELREKALVEDKRAT